MPVLTQHNRDQWSEWRWRFALIPDLGGQDESGNKVWVWLRWYQVRSKWQYKEYRSHYAERPVVMDLSY